MFIASVMPPNGARGSDGSAASAASSARGKSPSAVSLVWNQAMTPSMDADDFRHPSAS